MAFKADAQHGFGAWSGHDITIGTQAAPWHSSLATTDQDSEWYTNVLLTHRNLCKIHGHLAVCCPKLCCNDTAMSLSRVSSKPIALRASKRVGIPPNAHNTPTQATSTEAGSVAQWRQFHPASSGTLGLSCLSRFQLVNRFSFFLQILTLLLQFLRESQSLQVSCLLLYPLNSKH